MDCWKKGNSFKNCYGSEIDNYMNYSRIEDGTKFFVLCPTLPPYVL